MESKLLPPVLGFSSAGYLCATLSCAPLVRFVSDREEEERGAETA